MMKKEKKFYDLHCHAFNLSHPNMLAFLRHVKFPSLMVLGAYFILGPVLPFIVAQYLGKHKTIERAKNLLSVMENDIGNLFLLMEECVKSEENDFYQDGVLQIGGNRYHKMVLTPLMMDFGYKNLQEQKIHYNKPPQKPIVEQVVDVFNGIKNYQRITQGQGLFEIHPFLGINPRNYSLQQVEKMLDKYFRDYIGSEADLLVNQGQFSGDIDQMGSNFFAGIKVYPPLGFNPWPHDREERKKLEALYEFCSLKQIPVTTHCSNGGFVVVGKEELNECQDPQRWVEVLERYPELKLNLAHFGYPKKYITPVLRMLREYPNVYADLSYLGYEDKYYKKVKQQIQQISGKAEQERFKDHLIFGTDFMMQLLRIDSYSGYIKIYSDTTQLSSDDKDRFGSRNAERFLFGDQVRTKVEQSVIEEGEEVEKDVLVMV